MRRIEIITPQNVPITYQLASVRERGLALILDAFILVGVLTLLYSIISATGLDPVTRNSLVLLINFPIFIFYSLAFEVFTGGQTPGKIALRIRVIKLNGSELSLTDYLLRWAFRWIDIWGSLGSIAALQVSSSDKGQRLGDLLADTSVVKSQTDFRVSLNDLLKIKDKSDYEVTYPEVIAMNEQEMLTVKMALDQLKKYPNQAHFEVANNVSKNIAAKLQLGKYPKNSNEFLNTLIKDYVTLTRS
ncbi:MAG: RDD family protein [Bacteroidia bacterium]